MDRIKTYPNKPEYIDAHLYKIIRILCTKQSTIQCSGMGTVGKKPKEDRICMARPSSKNSYKWIQEKNVSSEYLKSRKENSTEASSTGRTDTHDLDWSFKYSNDDLKTIT